MTRGQRTLKRSFDVAASLAALLVLWPVILLLAAGVKLTSRGPAFFLHDRVGRYGGRFRVCKLRTMVYSEETGIPITTARDERITPFGRFLRRYKLDELPQLWNILKGDMSFVGPRPDVPGYADALCGGDRRILELRPGATGPATLCFRDEEELLAKQENPTEYNDRVVFPAKVRLNVEYMDTWSFLRDLGYLLVTACPACDRWLRLVPRREGIGNAPEVNHG